MLRQLSLASLLLVLSTSLEVTAVPTPIEDYHPNTWTGGVAVDAHGNGANWQGGYWNGQEISQGTAFEHGHGHSWNEVENLHKRDGGYPGTWHGGAADDGHGRSINGHGGHWNGREVVQGTAYDNGAGASLSYVKDLHKRDGGYPNTWTGGVAVDAHGNGANWQGGYWNGQEVSQGTAFEHGHGHSWNNVENLHKRDGGHPNTWDGGVAVDAHGNGVNWQGGNWNGQEISQGTAFDHGHGFSWNCVNDKCDKTNDKNDRKNEKPHHDDKYDNGKKDTYAPEKPHTDDKKEDTYKPDTKVENGKTN